MKLIMKVETKYDLNDTVWYISNNKVNSQKVTGIYISVSGLEHIEYYLQFGDVKYPESILFPTKEELLNSL